MIDLVSYIIHELRTSGDPTEEQWADEIKRLRAAKTAALKLADERAIEAVEMRAKLESSRKAFNEIFRYSNEKWIVDVALIARNQITLTDEEGKS